MSNELVRTTWTRLIDFAPCPKCGRDEPSVVFMNKGGFTPDGWPRYCQHGDEEHFDAECNRCGFRWRAEMNGQIEHA